MFCAQVQRQGSMRRQLSHMGELVHSALGDAHTSTQAYAPCTLPSAQGSGPVQAMQGAWLGTSCRALISQPTGSLP